MLDLLIAAIAGLFAGGIVNLLADELPYRRWPGIPRYPDGTPRPITAWLGLTAFALNQVKPKNPQPDEALSRPHRNSNALSWRHPATELMTAFFFVLAAYAAPNIPFMNDAQYYLNFVYMAIFALIIVIDMEHKLILFVVIVPAIMLAVLDAWLIPRPWPGLVDALIGAAAGFGFFFLIYLGGFAFTWYMNKYRGRDIDTVAFGYGDVMMITFSGALLGLLATFQAIFLTTLFGAIGSALYLIGRRMSGGQYDAFVALPYGPYIVFGTMIVFLFMR